ncbi:LysM peptidoglycan-binding domain-containing protein [Sporosarcina sp. BI001-red]|uniref:LysM peptidoglycan-binding domain-containing protein n=1 Tax=Sporosarcina sp. BI001-red TaxID=2282866 RepID=UPI000E253D52|nr:LysM peptidoglycan-binding domain-containing protein [Sporosarcina sp. BI001-red]REB09879.1 LysM peptidoglycan-binding domain-containing protein [Sporosarcina sp. BI001-red]
MTKSDYNSEFEENRKEIDLGENTNDDLPSRVKLRQNKNATPKRDKKESRKGLTLINIILVLFTLIPIGIFVYVLSDLYNPKDDNTVNFDTSDMTFELGSSQSPNSSSEVPVNADENKKDDDSKSDEDSKKDKKPEPAKPEKKPEVTQKPDPKPEVKPNPKPDPKPEVKPDPKPEVKPDPKPDPKPEVKPSGKSHTVQPNETLYRISVNYYGSGSGVEKIKAANGLSSNSISVGQTLVIP